jgi:hypothetical protein
MTPDHLMAHVRALCEIGARPATSEAERRAAGSASDPIAK